MKKKLIAALAAAITALCCLAAPVSAEESRYQQGDVDRNGRIGLNDAMLAFKEYTMSWLGLYGPGFVLDDEQIALCAVTEHSDEDLAARIEKLNLKNDQHTRVMLERYRKKGYVTIADAQAILFYYTYGVLAHNPKILSLDVPTYAQHISEIQAGTYFES